MKKRRMVLLVVFIADLILFFTVSMIANHYDKVGPPVLVNALLFFFIYRNKKAAYIAFYVVAALGILIAVLSPLFLILKNRTTVVPFAYGSIASGVAYALTLVAIKYAKSS